MSPLSLRRYRAERLLREQFEQLRRGVIAGVASRLRAVGVRLDESDLEACYAQAWHGLYAAVLDGTEVESAEAWLALVTYRRALDEHRSRTRAKRLAIELHGGGSLDGLAAGDAHQAPARGSARGAGAGASFEQRDLADALDDRLRLRQLFEALGGRLSAREQQAATLCYLHGLSRAEAARRMGVSDARMRKLMDGRGERAPGVARKVGALLETIVAGRWCEEQASLMRGFAYGILDPAGERHRLAGLHYSECSACRAYVLSLRGLAAALPPIPSLLAPLLGAGAGGAAAAGGSSGSAIGASALSASSAAGAGAGAASAGGGWWLAGSLGAKLAAGCLLALGVGCVALGVRSSEHRAGERRAQPTARRELGSPERARAAPSAALSAADALARGSATRTSAGAQITPAEQAEREFGPEQTAQPSAARASGAVAHVASRARPSSATASEAVPGASGSVVASASRRERAASAALPAAEREFAPG